MSAEINIKQYIPAFRYGVPLTLDLLDTTDATLNQVIKFDGTEAVWSSDTGLTAVSHDETLTGDGTVGDPLSVVGGDISDAVISVRVATTAALPGAPTYNNGVAGVGATLTRGSNGALTAIDGINLIVGDRLLVKNQASTLQNGIYEVTTLGSAGAPYVLTRTTDADTTEEMDELVVSPSEGTQRATLFGQQTNLPTIGTSSITFATTTSLFVSQATSGTQTNGNIPYYSTVARQLRRGDTGFNRNPTTFATTLIQNKSGSRRGLDIDTLTTDAAVLSSYLSGQGSKITISNTSAKILAEKTGSTIQFDADLAGSPNQGQLMFDDLTGNRNSRFNVRADNAIMVHVSNTSSSISKRIIVDTDGVKIQNNSGTLPKFVLRNGDTSTEYVSFDPNTGQYIFTLSAYADNAAASAAGLPVGALYYTNSGGDGLVKIVI